MSFYHFHCFEFAARKMSLQQIESEALAISCPLRWFVLALCIATPMEAAILLKANCNESISITFISLSFKNL